MGNVFDSLKKELLDPLRRRITCTHQGESGLYCARCGADLRAVASYECRMCGLRGRPRIYPAESAPDFCTQCGAPRITFRAVRKKRSGPS